MNRYAGGKGVFVYRCDGRRDIYLSRAGGKGVFADFRYVFHTVNGDIRRDGYPLAVGGCGHGVAVLGI